MLFRSLVSIVDEYTNLDLIGNVRIDSVMYDPAPARTGRRGRPAKHWKRLSVDADFTLSNEKIGAYYTGVRRVLTNIFGNREVLLMLLPLKKSMVQSDCFSVQFSRKSCRFSVPVRKTPH